jgi:hypothetical protein
MTVLNVSTDPTVYISKFNIGVTLAVHECSVGIGKIVECVCGYVLTFNRVVLKT